MAVGTFAETLDFDIPAGTATDASFVVSADGLATVLSDVGATLQMFVDGDWVDIASTEGGGVLGLLGLTVLGDNSVEISVDGLEPGTYRLEYSGGGLISAGITLSIDATFEHTTAEGQTIIGNVLEDDTRGSDDAAVLYIDQGDGTFVEVTDGTQIVGDYGTLTINADGSYSYEAFDDPTAVGQQDVFTYRLVHGTEGEDTATLTINIAEGDIDPAPLAALASDTGTDGDGITSDGTVDVSGLEDGSTWQYSTDGGATWTDGEGSSFVLPDGEYADGDVLVRQVDGDGNVSTEASLGPVTVDGTDPDVLAAALASDTGTADDGVTSDGTVDVTGIEDGATWQYSTDGGDTWIDGVGTSFELAPGTYADGDILVHQTDAAGNTSADTPLGPVTVDDSVDAPTPALESDTGTAGDGITTDGTVNVTGIEDGATWQYSTDGGDTWIDGVGTSFELAPGTYADGEILVHQTDEAGNTSTDGSLGPVSIDLTADPLTPVLASDTGTAGDGITGDGTVDVTGLEDGATWQYSTDGGDTWVDGVGTSFELAPGTYADGDILVHQTDGAGNISGDSALGPVTVDTDVVAEDDSAALDMGEQVIGVPTTQTDAGIQVLGLLESDNGTDNGVTVTVPEDSSGDLEIQISQTALVAVGDAFRLDVVDAEGNIVYSAVTQNSLLGDVAGLDVLGVVGDDGLTASITGLPPGEYRVLVRNDESTLGNLFDADGDGVSLEELGSNGVILGDENQALIVSTIEDTIGLPIGFVLNPLLDVLNGTPVTDVVGAISSALSTIGFSGAVDDVIGAVAEALLNNTLTLLQSTTITTTLTEYDFPVETVSGNVIDGDAGVGTDDVASGATVTEVTNSDGHTETVPDGGSVTIVGEYGELEIFWDGSYTYNAYGIPGSVGQSEEFTYTLSDGVNSDTATLTIGIDGTVVTAADDSATAGFVWENVVDDAFFDDSGSAATLLIVQPDDTYDSASFTIGADMAVTGTVSVVATLAVTLGTTVVIQEETAPGVWTNVGTPVAYSGVAAALATVASIDLSTLGLDEGTYRVHVTLESAVAAGVNVNTDVNVIHTDQFVLDSATGDTGNLLTNDQPGSSHTELQVLDEGIYVDVEPGAPISVEGAYGTLTVQSDGSYTYIPNTEVGYFDTPQTDSFEYQLVHPSGQIAHGVLEVEVTPSGAGVVEGAEMSMMSFAMFENESLLGDQGSFDATDATDQQVPASDDDSGGDSDLPDDLLDTDANDHSTVDLPADSDGGDAGNDSQTGVEVVIYDDPADYAVVIEDPLHDELDQHSTTLL